MKSALVNDTKVYLCTNQLNKVTGRILKVKKTLVQNS